MQPHSMLQQRLPLPAALLLVVHKLLGPKACCHHDGQRLLVTICWGLNNAVEHNPVLPACCLALRRAFLQLSRCE